MQRDISRSSVNVIIYSDVKDVEDVVVTEMSLDITLFDAYKCIIEKLSSNDFRYKYYFYLDDDEWGQIKLDPTNTLSKSVRKISEIIGTKNEIQMKRELIINIDDGKIVQKYISSKKLESNLSEIRDELVKKRIILQDFKFLYFQQDDFQEVKLESERTMTLKEFLKNDDIIRVSFDKPFTIPCEPSESNLYENESIKNEEIEYLKHNIHICKLNHGLIFVKEGIKLGNNRSFDVVKPIHFKNDHSFIANLSVCKEKKDVFFIRNQIDQSLNDNLPPELQNIISYFHLSGDKRNAYFTVVNKRFEVYLKKEYIKPSEKLINAVNEAIEGIDDYLSYLKLLNIFAAFGNFFAQKIVLGQKLYTYFNMDSQEFIKSNYYANKAKEIDENTEKKINEAQENLVNCKIEWSINDDFRKNESLKQNLKHIDTDFSSSKGNIVSRNDFYTWIDFCIKMKNSTELQVVEYGNFVSFYEIFDELTRNKIKKILETYKYENYLLRVLQLSDENENIESKEKILMMDNICVDMSVTYYRVKFKNKLRSNDYKLYGSVTMSGQQIEQISKNVIKFTAKNIFGFSIIVESIYEEDKKVNINWMLVGNPEIIENLYELENINFQNFIVLAIGTESPKSQKKNLKINLSKFSKEAVFAYSFEYLSSNIVPSFKVDIKSIDDGKGIEVDISRIDNNGDDDNDDDEYQMHWCIYLTPIQSVAIGTKLTGFNSKFILEYKKSKVREKRWQNLI
ncbi:kinase-like protein [Gigaspora margarita]|uniref:Kinase-like protein n=1 Tax=Gigaspora margarita TaxID=4874 RepID=A0A8H4B4I1_GIGMA|nr:kinase-like protein [Gigaspora margarita]